MIVPSLRDVMKIEAVYERPGDGNIVFFSGAKFWVSDGNTGRGPYKLTELGLPPTLDRIDAVFVWGKNSHTYIFSGQQYWK